MDDEQDEAYYASFMKAVEYYEADNYIPALAFFERALELGDTNISINAYIGGIYKEIERYEDAFISYNKIIAELEQKPFIQENGKPMQFYSDRAFVNIALEKYDEAIVDYNRAIEIENDKASYYNGRAQAYYFKDKFTEAISDMSKAISIDDSFSWYWERRASIFANINMHEQSSYDTFRAYLARCVNVSDDEDD
jgi:tetratricopeptide (TPR) repeat protein